MPGTCVIGLQWGDEAKGKLVDILTGDHDIVVRYQGGANAGHTVVSAGQTWKLSLIPSGILRDGVACVITGGVVLDPARVIEEIDGLESRGVRVAGKLQISDRAHVVFPWHIAEDRLLDGSLSGGGAIGTTGRGTYGHWVDGRYVPDPTRVPKGWEGGVTARLSENLGLLGRIG
ncbi:MAG: hypothetical protein EBR23_02410, partial [Planctomycetia bacterium]|nr:hypothetical protein [Planctomycetia bacterium]